MKNYTKEEIDLFWEVRKTSDYEFSFMLKSHPSSKGRDKDVDEFIYQLDRLSQINESRAKSLWKVYAETDWEGAWKTSLRIALVTIGFLLAFISTIIAVIYLLVTK